MKKFGPYNFVKFKPGANNTSAENPLENFIKILQGENVENSTVENTQSTDNNEDAPQVINEEDYTTPKKGLDYYENQKKIISTIEKSRKIK